MPLASYRWMAAQLPLLQGAAIRPPGHQYMLPGELPAPPTDTLVG